MPWPWLWNSFYRGEALRQRTRKVDFIKRIYGSIVLAERIRAAGTAF